MALPGVAALSKEAMKMAVAPKVTLSSPSEVEGEWEYSWFDSAHQHFLLLNDSYFYLLPYHDTNPVPALFAHVRDLPSGLLCGRVSIDKKLLAIQISLSSLVVVDVSNKKQWVVEIRHPSENAILSGGLIWSDHGGNSEDLVIVTTKGIELYKISQVRSQCKLSRTVSQPVSAYWYNAEHRMVMLAAHAQPKYGYNRNPQSVFFTPEERPKEMLLVDGFFLNCEKSSIPMLELPPPDRVPRLEVGPGLGTDDISLVSLYGKILCLVRYVEHGMDFITVYHMTKQKAERIHCLALNCPTNGLLYSTYDNLLICHCIGERVSLVFDIMSTTARGKDGISSSDKTHPLGAASPMHYLHKHKGSAVVTAVGSARNSTTDRTVSHEGRRPSGLLGRNSSSNLSESDARSKSRDIGEWGAVVAPQPRGSRLGQTMILGKKESDITSFDTLVFTGELSASPGAPSANSSPHPDGAASTGNASDPTHQHVVLTTPEPALDVYSTYAFEYLAPNILFDSHRRIAWDIQCAFPAIVRELSHLPADTKDIPMFLARRGQCYSRLKQSAEGALEYNQITLEGRWAKQLMLGEMYSMLLRKADPTSLKAYFRSLMRPYGAEYRRLILAHYEAMHAPEVGTAAAPATQVVAPATGGSTSIFSMTAAARRRVMAESIFGSPPKRSSTTPSGTTAAPGYGGNMGVYPGLLNVVTGGSVQAAGAPEGDVPNALEMDPLELGGTMQLLLPDISMVGVRARKQEYARQQASSTSTSAAASAPRIKPTCQAIALHTRRDISGCLIATQAEIVSHVWLPLLLNSDVDYDYCALALAVFIAHLRENNLSIAPAFSALLLNVLFHSHKYSEVSRMLQQRELPDSLDLALYSLEFCDMLHDHLRNLQDAMAQDAAVPTVDALSGVTELDNVLRHRCALANMRQAALDVLHRLDERTTLAKWHLSHGHILEALAVCKKRNGQWQAPLTPGSIPASEFFQAAVTAVSDLLKPLDEEALKRPQEESQMSAKESCKLAERRAAATSASVDIFYTLYLFLKEWDGVVLLSSTNTGRSRLSAQVAFPDHLFGERNSEQFKKLFGFV